VRNSKAVDGKIVWASAKEQPATSFLQGKEIAA